LSGHAASDDVIDALHMWAPMHLVAPQGEDAAAAAGLRGTRPVDGAAVLLTAIRRADPVGRSGIRLVLPAPGDVQGLPPGTAFGAAALAAGEGVLVGVPGTPGLGLVPTTEGPDVLRWNVFALSALPGPATPPGLGEAEFALRDAVRGAAAALTGIQTVDTDGAGTDPRAEIAEQVAEFARHTYPGVLPSRTIRILDSADQVAAILAVAARGRGLQAGSVSAATSREEALRPLRSAVRLARLGAVAATLGAVAEDRPATGG
jgi:hypothetical protein